MITRRKLYSNVDGQRTPINETKLFSGAAAVKAAEVAKAGKGKVIEALKAGKNWITNNGAQATAKSYKEAMAGKNLKGAAKNSVEKKLAGLNKEASVALKRQIGVGAGAAAVAGTGVAAASRSRKSEEAQKTYSRQVLMTEEQYRMFSEFLESQKEFAKKEEEKKIRLGSKARIWIDKNVATKKDREAIIEAYDQEGPRKSGKLGKQAAKWGAGMGAVEGAILGGANGGVKGAVAGAAGGAIGGAVGGYAGARIGHQIQKGKNYISETAAHQSQKTADEAKVASGKMTKEDFAKKYGRQKKKAKK